MVPEGEADVGDGEHRAGRGGRGLWGPAACDPLADEAVVLVAGGLGAVGAARAEPVTAAVDDDVRAFGGAVAAVPGFGRSGAGHDAAP